MLGEGETIKYLYIDFKERHVIMSLVENITPKESKMEKEDSCS